MRGNVHSVIVIEPIDAFKSRVRYVAEVEPKGWLPTIVSRCSIEGDRWIEIGGVFSCLFVIVAKDDA